MKIAPSIEIADFEVPTLVREKSASIAPAPAPVAPGAVAKPADYYIGPREYRLSELSSEELHQLCERFVNAVFRQANKSRVFGDPCAKGDALVQKCEAVDRLAEDSGHISG